MMKFFCLSNSMENMKKFMNKISQVIQILLLAPVQLPNKVLKIIKYVALSVGLLEEILEDKDDKENDTKEQDDHAE